MPSIDSGLTSTGVIIGVNPSSTACWMAELQQRQLQQRADAGEEVEPAARHLRAALHVDRAEQLAELQVVARVVDAPAGRRPRAARRSRPRRRAARPPRPHSAPQTAPRAAPASASVTAASAALTCADNSLVRASSAFALVALGLRHLLAQLLLLGPQRLECRDRGAPASHRRRSSVVDHGLGLAPGALAGADQVGILSEQPQVNHDS